MKRPGLTCRALRLFRLSCYGERLTQPDELVVLFPWGKETHNGMNRRNKGVRSEPQRFVKAVH
jgi:hypothetical protein